MHLEGLEEAMKHKGLTLPYAPLSMPALHAPSKGLPIMRIIDLHGLVATDLEAVNQLMLSHVRSQVPLIEALSEHLLQSGGKRLRPLLVLLASHASGYEGRDHVTMAAMVEYFHTATLLHDDVVDDSTLRRGRETAHEIWGSKASILVGDYLFTESVQLMVSLNHTGILRLMAKTSHDISTGELKQLANRKNLTLSLEDYFDVIRAKTALLFGACACIGALLAEQPKPVCDALYGYGIHLGNAFQLIDDVLDYAADVSLLGKNTGDDLSDGKLTMPLIHVLQYGTEAQKMLVKTSLTGDEKPDFSAILDVLHDTSALDATRTLAADEMAQALTHLTILPDSAYKDALTHLAHYALNRIH